MSFMPLPGETVFARWRDGYYYPAVVDVVLGNELKVSYLDGYTGQVSVEHVVEMQEAFETMQFQGNWKSGGFFFKGTIASFLPAMIMHYNDGDVEQIELHQLRGVRPKAAKTAARTEQAEPIQSERDALKELKSWLKAGLITKEEYKRRRDLLR